VDLRLLWLITLYQYRGLQKSDQYRGLQKSDNTKVYKQSKKIDMVMELMEFF